MTRADFDQLVQQFHEAIADVAASGQSASAITTVIHSLASRRQKTQLYEDLDFFFSQLRPAARVLDFGTGGSLPAVCFAAQGHRVSGIDVDDYLKDESTFSQFAKEQTLLWPRLVSRWPSLDFQHFHQNIPFANATFDAVMAYGVIEHIPEEYLDSELREVSRVLKPSGRLFISYLPRKWALCEHAAKAIGRRAHDRLWGEREVRTFLSKHGFRILNFRRIVLAPQHPSAFSNRWHTLFNVIDALAKVTPLTYLTHHMRIVAEKQ